jgi:hypothetical protein
LFIAGETCLHGGRITCAGKLVEDASADYIILRAAGGMRDAIANKAIENFAGARGRKFRGRDCGGLRRWRAQAFKGKNKDNCEN